ncbi:MAG TPA: YggS family pyridoxal phosphate-dependent enzyme, partial [Candidatus Atribacteria bacterium]|nr:YggS family pyridoxal phosphate-dependent enzyme [Candidatus Atribacteria bacterium]
SEDDIVLIGVTKYAKAAEIEAAVNAGLIHLGENRVQDFLKKYEAIDNSRIKWHFIGKLQRNKVKYIINKVSLIHSLDNLPLAREINRHALASNIIMPVLVQVNIANEVTKSGLPIEEVLPFIETLYSLKNIQVKGLMTIAPLVDDPEDAKPCFRAMKQLFNELKSYNYPHTDIKYLSMGMTNDFEVAISEGSNMIRIGRGIFTSK